MDRLSRRVKVAVGRINLWSVASTERNVAVLVRKTHNEYGLLLNKYRANDGSLLLHVVKECPRHYSLGYLVPRASPFLPYFNQGIARLVEAGILEYWKKITPHSTEMNNEFDTTNLTAIAKANTENPKVFSLKDLQLAFYILVVGLSVSIVIFLLEIVSMKKESH
jgi:hypothetical protein